MTKPHYLYNPVTNKLDNVNDPNFGKTQMTDYLTKSGKNSVSGGTVLANKNKSDTKPTPENNKMLKYIDDHNIVGRDKKATKSEAEAAAKRLDSYKNYPTRATPEAFGKLAENIERQRQQTGELSTWELMKGTADTPAQRNDLKRMLNKEYYKRGPKNMDPDDLKFIGKHKSQIVYPEIKIPSVINLDLVERRTPPEPELPLREQIKVLADRRLKTEQNAWDQQHGRSGLIDLLRPK